MTRIIATNSAPRSTNSAEAEKKARMRKSTECTALREATTISAEAMVAAAKR